MISDGFRRTGCEMKYQGGGCTVFRVKERR
jgi:hypothetical protein